MDLGHRAASSIISARARPACLPPATHCLRAWREWAWICHCALATLLTHLSAFVRRHSFSSLQNLELLTTISQPQLLLRRHSFLPAAEIAQHHSMSSSSLFCLLYLLLAAGARGFVGDRLSRPRAVEAWWAAGPHPSQVQRRRDELRLRMTGGGTASGTTILKRVDKWACVSGCGACCKLGPLTSRPDLEEYLSPTELTTYVSMIGADDWCIHFDSTSRRCKIYDDRPGFCIVRPEKFKEMFDVDEEDLSDFAAFCCREHIGDLYGESSIELSRFEEIIDSLYDEAEAEANMRN